MDVPAKIRKQVDFYFSDSNFPFDKFLYFLSKKNSEGWIPLETVAGFKKMKMITEDQEQVVSALRSGDSDLVELNEAGDHIRRTKPLVEQNFVSRSIYAKGFPLVDEGAEKPIDALIELQDKIEEFFQEHGKVLAVRLRKTDARPSVFKGSVYIEFDNISTAEEVAAKSLQYEGKDLLLKTKRQYLDEKSEKYRNEPKTKFNNNKKFNAFKYERDGGKGHFNNGNKKFRDNNNRGNKRNNNDNYKDANYRLLKFKNAKDVTEEQIKELVGKDDVETIIKKEDGSGFVLLSKKVSRKVAYELKDKSVDVKFFAANNDESKEFAGESAPEPSTGEKRKAEDDIQQEDA
ncbi:hypothetical protein BDA99DRAFT_501505 [Phascolomyces articulosus]|uniref:Uncharacterized protein n=1 Tax=Phascolomyces articulosus TaxID=60185 RepID=A0AAD5K571_9FUNG|nr:hypothetical protein BDA99DRAFT_501505 [Phascolomyces articulosus]